ncbi:MAG TPA: hypothetical protein VHV51_18705 [Polyangiaceae bacterium]|jgi:hypothetical protein|nr:hypothetical protein [Polyangiaceae bacterium]
MSYSLEVRGAVRTIAATLVLSLGSLVVQPSAFAQSDDDRAGARVAATEGVKAINEKRWADAADLFTRAESLVHSPVHLLYLARAQVQLGKLVKARENYNRIIREHYAADAPDAFRQAQTSAQQEVGPLEGRLAAITVKLDGEKGNVTVTDNGEKVPAALIGLPLPVDPGTHTFAAQGTDLKSDPVTVTVAEGGKNSITLTVKSVPGTLALDATPPAPAATAAAAATPGAPAATAATTPPPGTTSDQGASNGGSGLKIGGYVALGVGVVGVGLGTVFLLQSKSKKSDADDLCNLPNGGCPLSKKSQIDSLDNDYKSAGTLAVVGYTVGGAALVTGAILLAVSGKHTESTAGITPWVGYQSAGVFGRF